MLYRVGLTSWHKGLKASGGGVNDIREVYVGTQLLREGA